MAASALASNALSSSVCMSALRRSGGGAEGGAEGGTKAWLNATTRSAFASVSVMLNNNLIASLRSDRSVSTGNLIFVVMTTL